MSLPIGTSDLYSIHVGGKIVFHQSHGFRIEWNLPTPKAALKSKSIAPKTKRSIGKMRSTFL